MKESNLLINLCAIFLIVLGLSIQIYTLSLDTRTFDVWFIFYMLSGIGNVIGLLTLFREDRRRQ